MLTITLLSLLVAAISGLVAWRSIRREHLRSNARVASLAAAIDGTTAFDGTALDDAFEFPPEADELTFEAVSPPSSTRRRLLTVATAAVVVVAGVVLIAMMNDRHEPPAKPIVSPHAESIELLSLEAERDGSTLAVIGRVRSRAEEPLTAITAVVSAVDAKGRPIGRGTAPVEPLMPRRESLFVVRIGDVNEAARYRVSFRSAAGVIRHVDRRVERASNES
jgi:hypothetical protein